MRISPSQIRMYNECEQKWYYSYVLELKPRDREKKFDKGTYAHELFHVYYHTLELGYAPGSDFAQQFMDSRLESDMAGASMENIDTLASIIPLIRKYVSRRSPVIDNGIKIVSAELEFKLDWEDDIILHGIIDLVYKSSSGAFIIRDHKTSEQVNSWNQDMLFLEGQFLFYSLWYLLTEGRVPEVEVNFINTYAYKKPVPDEQLFKLFRYKHNEQSILAFGENLRQTHQRMVDAKPTRVYNKQVCNYCAYKAVCHSEVRGLDTAVALSAFDKKDTSS